jgi:glycosyltransferase involved in cell wall biosynthesis
MKKILISSPILSASGYGEMARFALRALRQHEDKFDIYLNVLNWGVTGFLFEQNEEFEYIKSLRIKTDQYVQAAGGKPQFDVSLQITIPNEWKKLAPVNIGYTAGIETHVMSPAWFQPCQEMDKIITISEFAKNVIQHTIFTDGKGNQFKVSTPVEVVHFPFKESNEKPLDILLPSPFNFLTVNQWGPRKNMEFLISNFIDEFRDEDVGLVVKTNIANDSTMDKMDLDQRMQSLLDSKGQRKCKIHVIHGRLNDEEMNGLYKHPNIKAFVTATHGEGFGMPIFEAMQAELPVVATDWSGHLDFLTMPDESGKDKKMFARVDFELKQIESQHVWPGVMEANSGWAFPTSSSLRSKMREVYKDGNRFKSWAKKLAAHNKQKFAKEKVCEDFFYSLGVFIKPKMLKAEPITGLSFCIPTHGKRLEKTLLTINSIKNQNWNCIPYEIIICGDITGFKNINNIILIEAAEEANTRKVACLRNKAAKQAKYDIVFCDDDIILEKEWLEKTLEYSKKNGWDVLANKVLSPDGTRYWDRATIKPHRLVDYDYPSNDTTLYQSSAFFIVRKAVFDKVKWDETKLVFADKEGQIPEDVQYSLDLLKNNFYFSFNKNALVWHNDDSYTALSILKTEQTLKKDMVRNQIPDYTFPQEHPRYIKTLKEII